MMMHLHLLFFCGLFCAALPPAVFSRAPTGDSSWKHRPSVHHVEDQKHFYGSRISTRQTDERFTSSYSRQPPELTARGYLRSPTQDSADLIIKRHSDAVFTDNYSRFRKQMAARKFLKSMLQGNRKFSR
ncbi:VIP peptides-like [Amphiprion ocellaris]|uniref:Glucagon / GIP / secretin / VIP family domain-containing protein n=1 Tax=Amphiprion ocellaris TaxID=80972 RepID=A0AAQ5ZAH0_AMPOC|nr:VIP peptides-like [Amphiprion ocellaris]